MKVVLFCGGLGTRLRERGDTIPKPLVTIGYRPLIWHLMRYYAFFGHTEFILALGYRGDLIREYFLNYSEAMSNDFTLSDSGQKISLHSRDLEDWRITFVDTGLHSNIGQRLLRVQDYLDGESEFLANYADGLSAMPLATQIEEFRSRDAIASLAVVPSAESFHTVQVNEDGIVRAVGSIQSEPILINGGFFVFRSDIFDYIEEGDELVEEPFSRLIEADKLVAYRWNGFFQSMDTLKDKICLDRREARGDCPWMVWEDSSPNGNAK